MHVYIKKVRENARIPTRATTGSVGYDLCSVDSGVVPAKSKLIVDTGIAVSICEGCYGRVAPRSGLAAKKSIAVMAGVIDQDYRDSIKVILFNHSDEDFVFEEGDRIAQLIFEKVELPTFVEGELCDTERGINGFGSTGV